MPPHKTWNASNFCGCSEQGAKTCILAWNACVWSERGTPLLKFLRVFRTRRQKISEWGVRAVRRRGNLAGNAVMSILKNFVNEKDPICAPCYYYWAAVRSMFLNRIHVWIESDACAPDKERTVQKWSSSADDDCAEQPSTTYRFPSRMPWAWRPVSLLNNTLMASYNGGSPRKNFCIFVFVCPSTGTIDCESKESRVQNVHKTTRLCGRFLAKRFITRKEL